MEILYFVTVSVALMLVWRFAYRRALLDNARDKLFDCRDRLRSTFIENGWALDGEGYKLARDSVNSHLRFIEDISVWKIIFVQAAMKATPEVLEAVQRKNQSVFDRLPVGQADFVKEVRQESLNAVMEFAILTSVLLMVISVVMAPFVVLRTVCEMMGRGFSAFMRIQVNSVHQVSVATGRMVKKTGAKVADMVFDRSVVEQCSFENRRLA